MNPGRSLSIDVLRGTAIILVLFRHHPLWLPLQTMGWIGVDLFFVLSGYLVSGLLFKEYALHGNIRPWRFLIRRGFKIYPSFYGLLPVAVLINIHLHNFRPVGLLSELVFLQNYLYGFGWWPFTITWSLAIEEHFYFSLCLVLWSVTRSGAINSRAFPRVVGSLMVLCLGLRLFSHHVFPLVLMGDVEQAHFTSTHFRYDALLCGVLIAWSQQYRPAPLKALLSALRPWVPWIIIALLAFTPFIEGTTSTFTMTWGFTCIYLAFGLLLAHVLMNVQHFPNNRFTRAVGAIGQWSYVIYLSHVFILAWFLKLAFVEEFLGPSNWVRFPIYFALSVALGAAISLTWERGFLKLRDRWFPSRHLR